MKPHSLTPVMSAIIPYEPQFQAFIDSIGRNEPMPLTDFDTAFETHRVVFAADMSAEAGGRTVKTVRTRLNYHRMAALAIELNLLHIARHSYLDRLALPIRIFNHNRCA